MRSAYVGRVGLSECGSRVLIPEVVRTTPPAHWEDLQNPAPIGLGLNLSTKKTRKREFLEEMERVVPWLRIYYVQQWFGLSDPAMEEALHDVPLYREFANLDGASARLPDESTILRFRHLLETHNLAVDMLRVASPP